jgi:hypothetical protein
VARHLWRRLIDAWRVAGKESAGDAAPAIAATLFVFPVIVVTGPAAPRAGGQIGDGETGGGAVAIAATIGEPERVGALLREHRALAGNQTFTLGDSLVGADALAVDRLPGLLAWQQSAVTATLAPLALAPLPLSVAAEQETVHLRFLFGAAFAAPGVDLLRNEGEGGWRMPLAYELSRQLAVAGTSVLVLARDPRDPVSALQSGRVSQREIAAQLFASNAIRRLRGHVGEPSAVISAHTSTDAVGGGELRLSLSSAFDPRQAEGFRCPLFAGDRVDDVVQMLVDLLHDCRVTDIRVRPGVHGDRDDETGLLLLFKPEGDERANVH